MSKFTALSLMFLLSIAACTPPPDSSGEPGTSGPKGDPGPMGPKGDTGATGPSGPKGDTGDPGPQGVPGATGSKGDTGPVGVKGDKGDIGPAGPMGPQGVTGLVGPIGPKGDKGDIGPVGAQGPQGPMGPQGPEGPAGEVTGPVDGSMLVDGSVVRGKLARESVLPENHGRGNSIRSLFTNATSTSVRLYTVPVGKTFIVTDIVAFNSGHGVVTLLESNSNTPRANVITYNYNSGNPPPSQITSFQAGIRFDSGEVVGVYHPGSFGSVTLSGYEF